MPIKFSKRYFLIGSILGVLFCVLGYVSSISDYNKKYPSEQVAIRRLSIRIGEDQREELFSQMRKYSEKHQLEFYLSFYNGKQTFNIAMLGKEINIQAVSFVDDPELAFDFFESDPTNPPTKERVVELFNDLKSFISEIPNLTITEEK